MIDLISTREPRISCGVAILRRSQLGHENEEKELISTSRMNTASVFYLIIRCEETARGSGHFRPSVSVQIQTDLDLNERSFTARENVFVSPFLKNDGK